MSAIFYHDEEQKQLAEQMKMEHQSKVKKPIVTKIIPAQTFYDAEDYHQKYILRQNPALLKSLNLGPEELKHSTVAAHLNGYVCGFGSLEKVQENANRLGINTEQMDMIKKILGNKWYIF